MSSVRRVPTLSRILSAASSSAEIVAGPTARSSSARLAPPTVSEAAVRS